MPIKPIKLMKVLIVFCSNDMKTVLQYCFRNQNNSIPEQ